MNTVDIIVIAVIAISALIAFLRGFVREILTVGSWLGAALVTLYGFPVLRPRFEQWLPSSTLVAHVACGVSLFVGGLIILSVLSHMVARLVRGSALTAVDRSLGLLFGLARGAILVSLAYMIVVWLEPDLLKGARTEPMMARGANILRSLAPKELADSLPTEPPSAAAPGDSTKNDILKPPAYTNRQQDALQRLIDTAAGK